MFAWVDEVVPLPVGSSLAFGKRQAS